MRSVPTVRGSVPATDHTRRRRQADRYKTLDRSSHFLTGFRAAAEAARDLQWAAPTIEQLKDAHRSLGQAELAAVAIISHDYPIRFRIRVEFDIVTAGGNQAAISPHNVLANFIPTLTAPVSVPAERCLCGISMPQRHRLRST
jgi:hypothetical protein